MPVSESLLLVCMCLAGLHPPCVDDGILKLCVLPVMIDRCLRIGRLANMEGILPLAPAGCSCHMASMQ
jgi:hypothetical protein